MIRLKIPFCAALLLPVAACGGAPIQHSWEIQLVAGEDCGACSLFEDIREERGIGDVLRHDVEDLPDAVPIAMIEPAELSEADLERMAALPYMSEAEARELARGESLLVLVRHDGRIQAAGNISWSAHLPAARFPDVVMEPPASAPFDEITREPSAYYRQYFGDHWSLAYFLELALDPAAARPHTFAGAFDPSPAAAGFELEEANVFIAGSGATPAGNPLFVPERIREIRQALVDQRGVPASRIEIFFGDGGGMANDTSVERSGELRFRPVNLDGERSLDGQTLVDWFEAMRRRDTRRNLIVQVGHGAPWGMPLWGHLAALTPRELGELHDQSGAENIIVSGACFGGIFAESTSCGFFAARPDVVAAGCQRSPEAIAGSDDYPRWYFRSLAPEYRDQADADDDGAISLREAHWFAATRLEHDQIPYTTLDAVADRYFQEHPSALPVSLTPGVLRSFAGQAPAAERRALERLLAGLPEGRVINLVDPAGQKRAAARKAEGLADAGSAQRNEAMDLPYRLALVQLARRLIYRELTGTGTASVDACESRAFKDFME